MKKSRLKIELTVAIFILFMFYINLNSQHRYYIPEGMIIDNFKINKPKLTSFDENFILFDGYMVIKINDIFSNQKTDTNKNPKFDVFWISDLDNITNPEFIYFSDIGLSLSSIYLFEADREYLTDRNLIYYFSKIYYIINSGLDNKCKLPLSNFGIGTIFSNILDTSLIFMKNNDYFVIYKNTFFAAIINIRDIKIENNDEFSYKSLLPLSKMFQLDPINVSEAFQHGFLLSEFQILNIKLE